LTSTGKAAVLSPVSKMKKATGTQGRNDEISAV